MKDGPATPSEPARTVAPPKRSASSGGRRFGALRHRNFVLLWIGLITSNTGTWMQMVAQGFLIYDLTGSKTLLGMVGVSRAIPMILFPLWGGVVADRADRMKLLWITQAGYTVIIVILAVLITVEMIEPWHIIAASFFSAIVNAFDQPARQALLPHLVPREDFLSATSLNSAVFNGAAFTGPALYGLLVPLIGIAGAFYANALSGIAVFIALALMRMPKQTSGSSRGSPLQNLVEGLRFVRAHQVISTILILAAIASLLGRSYTFLLPALIQDILMVGAAEATQLIAQSYLTSAAGFGTLVGAFGLAGLGTSWRRGRLMFGSGLIFAVLLIGFGLSTQYWLSGVLIALVALMNAVFGATCSTLLQLLAPGALRGRIMSLYTLCFLGLTPLGAGILGFTADLVGVATAITGAAVIIGLATGALALARPEVRAA